MSVIVVAMSAEVVAVSAVVLVAVSAVNVVAVVETNKDNSPKSRYEEFTA